MTSIDVFEYLKQDGAHIAERLNTTVNQYSEWPRDRFFEETKRTLEAVRGYFSKESLLSNNLKDTQGTEAIVEEAEKQRGNIQADIENLVMVHVDEPGFDQMLGSIADKMNQHCDFCEEEFFPAMKEHLSADDIKHVKEQLDQEILS
jgi:transcriptional regulator with XRE-family HTH domain